MTEWSLGPAGAEPVQAAKPVSPPAGGDCLSSDLASTDATLPLPPALPPDGQPGGAWVALEDGWGKTGAAGPARPRGANILRALRWTIWLTGVAVASLVGLCVALALPSVPDIGKTIALAATMSSVALLVTATFALYDGVMRAARR